MVRWTMQARALLGAVLCGVQIVAVPHGEDDGHGDERHHGSGHHKRRDRSPRPYALLYVSD